MSNMTITNVDLGPIQLGGDHQYVDDVLLGAASHAFLAGTILARQTVTTAIPAVITGTGTHVLTPTATAGRTPQVGAYTMLAGTLGGGVGPWTLTAPDGQTETLTTSSKTAAMVFPRLGLTIGVATAGNDFVSADSVAITPAALATYPLVAFSPTGSNGAQKPVAILNKAQTVASNGTSIQIRPILSGTVNATRLIIDADTNGTNITKAILDQLRDTGIIALPVQQLAALDDQ